MESTDIKPRLKQVLVQALGLERDPASLPDANLRAELGLDSISSLEFLVWVENEFQIEIADEFLSSALVDSLDKLADYVSERTRERLVAQAPADAPQ